MRVVLICAGLTASFTAGAATVPACRADGPPPLSVAASRTSGVAPLAVFFDATGTTSPATNKPFHNIEYRWDFGDPGSGTWTTGSRPGASSRNSATGAVAAHVFETPGTYTVAMTAHDGTNTASCSVQVAVTDPDIVFSGANTICFSRSGTFTGCPTGARTITTSSFATVRSNLASGKRLLLRRGDAFDASGNLGFNNVNGPWILGAFGSGAKPVVRAMSRGTELFKYGNGGGPYSDVRLVDLAFDGNGQAEVVGTSYLGGGANRAQPFYYSDFLMLRVDVRNVYRGFMTMQQTGVFVVDSSVISTGYSFFSGGMINSAVLGSSFTETTVVDAGEGNMRWGNANKLAISNNDIIGGQYFRQHIKLHAQAGTPSEYVVISDNRFAGFGHGGGDVWWIEIGPANANETEIVQDFIVERNWFTGNGVVTRYIYINEKRGTVRNNLFDFSRGDRLGQNYAVSIFQFGAGVPAPDDIQVYNNTAYSSAANTNSQGFAMVMVDEQGRGATNIVIRNNFASMPNYTNKRMIIDPFSRATASNNILANTPGWVGATPSIPADFKPAPGSPAIGAGVVVPVWSDFHRARQPMPRDVGAVNH